MIMTADMVTQTSGASSNAQSPVTVLVNLARIINSSRSALSHLVKIYADRNCTWASYESVFYAFLHDLEEVFEEAVSAIEHLYISNPNNVQLREVNTMMSRGRRFAQNGRYSGRNNHQHRCTPGTEPARQPTSSRLSQDDEDTSDFETISSCATFTVNEDEEDSDDESSECSESESDQYYYYSYLSMSDLASDGASIRSDDSISDDEEDFSDDDEFVDDELEDWTKPVRLAKTCHVLKESVVREMLRTDYVPQWFDVVDLVLESEEQVLKGPAEPEFSSDGRAFQDPAKDFSKLINKELVRNEQAQMISLVRTAPESTRLEITATTLFTPSNPEATNEDLIDMH